MKPPRERLARTVRRNGLFGGLRCCRFCLGSSKIGFKPAIRFFRCWKTGLPARLHGRVAAASFGGVGIFAKRRAALRRKCLADSSACHLGFFSGQDDNPQFFDGVLTPVLIAFLPWAFKGKWLEEKKLLAGFALLVFILRVISCRFAHSLRPRRSCRRW